MALSTMQIYLWTSRPEAVTACFIRDVYEMKEDACKDMEMFWLRSWPCRIVELVGIVVGVQEYEKKTIISIDDGSAVIDSIKYHNTDPPKPGKYVPAPAPPPAPPPMPPIGSLVKMTGKVAKWHDSRQIFINKIEECPASMEPEHWLKVTALHQNTYSKPFSMPDLSNLPVEKTLPSNRTSKPSCNSPTKLRHPSKLRSRDLTDNTFRIYLKYYMNTALYDQDPHRTLEPPRKQLRRHDHNTPLHPSDDLLENEGQKRQVDIVAGFTQSYLRQVPELKQLARQVVKAERTRLEKGMTRQKREINKSGSSSKTGIPPSLLTNRIGPKVKRLFAYAIRQLYEEGSIVLHKGPVRIWRREGGDISSRSIWQSRDQDNSSTLNTTSITALSVTEDAATSGSDDDVSEVPSNEESYVPMSTSLIKAPIKEAISGVVEAAAEARVALMPRYGNGVRSKAPKKEGATPEEILKWMQNDERWAKVGDWSILAALAEMEKDEVVWKIGKGIWAIM